MIDWKEIEREAQGLGLLTPYADMSDRAVSEWMLRGTISRGVPRSIVIRALEIAVNENYDMVQLINFLDAIPPEMADLGPGM